MRLFRAHLPKEPAGGKTGEPAGGETGEWTPDGPITILNYVATGGAMDLATRKFVEIASKYTDATFVVDNMTGASGMIAAIQMAKALGINPQVVPHESGPLAINAVLGGQGAASVGNPGDTTKYDVRALVPAALGAFFAILKEDNKPDKPYGQWTLALGVAAGAIFSVVLFQYVGYYVSSARFIFAVMWVMEERNWKMLIGTPVCWVKAALAAGSGEVVDDAETVDAVETVDVVEAAETADAVEDADAAEPVQKP